MKISKSILALIIVTSSIMMTMDKSSAASYDLYHDTNQALDFDFFTVAEDNNAFFTVAEQTSHYYIELPDGKFYSESELTKMLEKGDNSVNDAMNKLKPFILVNKKSVEEEINSKIIDNENIYTATSAKKYEEAKNEYLKTTEKRFVREEEYDRLRNNFINAYNSLELENVDTTELEKEVKSADSENLNMYTDETANNLKSALDKAKALLKKEKITKSELDKVTEELKLAHKSLKKKIEVRVVLNPERKSVTVGETVELPKNIEVVYSNGRKGNLTVNWDLTGVDFNSPGTKNIYGSVTGTDKKAEIEVLVKERINKNELQKSIEKLEELSNKPLSESDKITVESELKIAKKIFDESKNQSEIDNEVKSIEKIISEIKEHGLAEIYNIKPATIENVKSGDKVKISFDSLPGGKAKYEVRMPDFNPPVNRSSSSRMMLFRSFMPMNFMAIEPEYNMKEDPQKPGHYEGEWTVPEGFYGNNYEITVSLKLDDETEIDKAIKKPVNISEKETVRYIVNGKVYATESVEKGQSPKNIPEPKVEGYTFKEWQLNNSPVSPENFKVEKNTAFVAVMTPIQNVSYKVIYVDENGADIAEEKTVTDKAFGETVTEEAAHIPGYSFDQESKKLVLGKDNNVIKFVYKLSDEIPYTVKYECNGKEIRVADRKVGTYKKDNKVDIPEIEGYKPEVNSASINLSDLNNNEIVLNYVPRNDIPYQIKYVKVDEEGNEKVLDTVTSVGTLNEVVTPEKRDYIGLVPENENTAIKLTNAELNTGEVRYRLKDGIHYTIRFTDTHNGQWEEQHSGKFGQKISLDELKEKTFINEGHEYKIKNYTGDSEITLDDREDKNIIQVNVYEVFDINKNQDLKNLYNEAKKISIPDYGTNKEWEKYASEFNSVKEKFENEEINEYNIEELTTSLKEKIEIIKAFKDYDSAWGDRVKPKGFAATINDQNEKPQIGGRLKVKYIPQEGLIKLGMSDEQQKESFVAGAMGVGVKSAMINVLKSDNVYQVESKGIIAQIQDENGKRKSEDELISEGIKLAAKWLPDNILLYQGTWGDLIGTPRVDFIIRGKTSNGKIFEKTYYFEFVDKKDL